MSLNHTPVARDQYQLRSGVTANRRGHITTPKAPTIVVPNPTQHHDNPGAGATANHPTVAGLPASLSPNPSEASTVSLNTGSGNQVQQHGGIRLQGSTGAIPKSNGGGASVDAAKWVPQRNSRWATPNFEAQHNEVVEKLDNVYYRHPSYHRQSNACERPPYAGPQANLTNYSTNAWAGSGLNSNVTNNRDFFTNNSIPRPLVPAQVTMASDTPTPVAADYVMLPSTASLLDASKLLPVFDGSEALHPVDFLQMLENVVASTLLVPENLPVLFRTAFKGEAQLWLQAMMPIFRDYSSFRSAFLEQFWGIDRQMAIRFELESTKYHKGSYVQHFLKYAARGRYLQPPYPENFLVSAIARHFPPNISCSLIGASHFSDALQRLRQADYFCSNKPSESTATVASNPGRLSTQQRYSQNNNYNNNFRRDREQSFPEKRIALIDSQESPVPNELTCSENLQMLQQPASSWSRPNDGQ